MGRFQAEQPLFGKVCVGPNHAPPFTPFSRAVNMRSVQTDGSAHPHRERTSPTCFSRHRHCRRAVARSLIHSASISLHPFAPRALPRFIATTDALTPERPVLRVLIRGNERRACFPLRSPCFPYQTFQPFCLQPLVVAPGTWSGFDPELTAQPFGRIPFGDPGVTWASPLPSGLATTTSRIEFVILRTSRSPPVALHPLSRGRSYFRLQSSDQTLAGIFVLLI